MAAARCPECKAHSVMKNGIAVIVHERDCEVGNDYQPKLNETLRISDIVVPSSMDELHRIVERIRLHAGPKTRYPQAHIFTRVGGTPDYGPCFVEFRGYVRFVFDNETSTGVRVAFAMEGLEVVIYPGDEEPDTFNSVDISRLMRASSADSAHVHFVFSKFEPVTVSLIHEPSPHIPVVQK